MPLPPRVVPRPGRTTLYHWTRDESCAQSILEHGFRDTSYRHPRGVHLCDRYDAYRRSNLDVLLLVELPTVVVTPDRLDPIQMPEWRDYVIPAEVIRQHGVVRRAYR